MGVVPLGIYWELLHKRTRHDVELSQLLLMEPAAPHVLIVQHPAGRVAVRIFSVKTFSEVAEVRPVWGVGSAVHTAPPQPTQ